MCKRRWWEKVSFLWGGTRQSLLVRGCQAVVTPRLWLGLRQAGVRRLSAGVIPIELLVFSSCPLQPRFQQKMAVKTQSKFKGRGHTLGGGQTALVKRGVDERTKTRQRQSGGRQ